MSVSTGLERRQRVIGAGELRANGLYSVAGIAALVAFAANLLDVILGFGETDITVYGAQRAADWFALFAQDGFKGLYALGILNIVYMACMLPVYLALWTAHRHTHALSAALALILYLLGTAIYLANNAALPMLVLAQRYAAAGTDAQRALLAAAGEAVLARGEDFTPGAFIGMIAGALAALTISWVMLRGGVFGKTTAWVGIAGFGFLAIFTVWATFSQALYAVAYYGFAMIGGLLALAWFILVALAFFKLARSAPAAESGLTS